jgi:hypothetical protein
MDYLIIYSNQFIRINLKGLYSKNNENVTKITIFFVTIVSDKNLRKTYEKLTKFKTEINK